MMKRILASLLCLVMCLSMFPVEAFADATETDLEELEVCDHDHDHDHDYEDFTETVVEEDYSETPVEPYVEVPADDDTEAGAEEGTDPLGETGQTDVGTGDDGWTENPDDGQVPLSDEKGTENGEGIMLRASCSHTYTYTYNIKGHKQHEKVGTCSKCGATTSTMEDHTFSSGKCSKCGVYEPFTSTGYYEVINTSGVQLYATSSSSGTKVKLVSKGTILYVSKVELTSSNYYWGKVTKIGKTSQSSDAWVCMKSSDLKTHSHSYSYSYTIKDHTQHNKVGECACGTTTTTTESHSFSGNTCSKCGIYKPYTTDGDYDVISSTATLYKSNNESSGTRTTVSKGTHLKITNVAKTSTGYYWGKVTVIGTTAQSTEAWICMKSSLISPHSHSYSYSYSSKNNVEHNKVGTCSGCGATTTTAENHSFSNGKCTVCNADEPYKTAGTYVANNANGITIYSGRVSTAGTEVETGIAKGTHIKVINVQLNTNSNNYWGQVEMVGNRAPKSTAYVYMGKGTLAAHTHSYSYSYSEKSDTQHNVTGSCSCGYKTTSVASHSFSSGKCSLCGKAEVAHTTGGYVTTRDEALRDDVTQDSNSPKTVPKGGYIEISQIVTNQYGNYWGKVSSINGTAPSSVMYAYMGYLSPHTHTLTTTYSNVNNVEHDATTTCSGCAYSVKTRSNHSFSNMVCTACGGWQAYSSAGDYKVINADGVKLYPQRLAQGTESRTLQKGDFVHVEDVELNSAKNYWGRVTKIGSTAPSTTMYIYLGSGQVEPHTHSYSYSYSEKSDTQHTVTGTCACGNTTTSVASHSFSGGKCSLCGKAEVAHTTGGYVTTRDEALRDDVTQDSNSPKTVSKGGYIEISQVVLNQYGNYWGRVSSINGTAPSSVMYAYMGYLNPHTHTLTTTYSNVNNVEHDATTTCSGCAYSVKTRSNHSFSNMVCTVCGGWQAYSSAGDYKVINADGVKLYPQRLAQGTESRTLKKGDFVHVEDVELNTAKNYWGRVTRIGSETPSKTMYIYLGSGQVEPHSHSYIYVSTEKSDTQHTVTGTCACGSKTTSVEDHSFTSGVCVLCGKKEVAHIPGTYMTYRDTETLRKDTFETADEAEKVQRGTFIQISEVIENKYGNYWGKVSLIGSSAPDTDTYAYMGHLNPHTHTLTTTYSNVNNVEHDETVTCLECNYKTKTRTQHSFSNMRCTACGGWQAYSEDGVYLVINTDGVKAYSQRITSGTSTEMKMLPWNSAVEVRDVELNSANNYWGEIVSIDGIPTTICMYVYMGSGQVKPHTHTTVVSCPSSCDTSHTVQETCTECGAVISSGKEQHSFKNGECEKCGHAQVANTTGDYVPWRASEPLRKGVSMYAEAIEHAEKGTYLKIDHVYINDAGNYWGRVAEMGSQKLNPPLYVYMGNVAAHKHSLVISYAGSNNVEHKKTQQCTCGYIKTDPEPHSFSNGVCENCTAWEAYSEDGSYLVINTDGVKVYSQRITSGTSTEVKKLPWNSYVEVKDVELNSANNYWGEIVSIDGISVTTCMYIYMGRGQVSPHTHSFSTNYQSKSDTQHYKTAKACTVCGYSENEPTIEQHNMVEGMCTLCGKEEVPHTPGNYVTFRTSETLRLNTFEKAESAEKPTAGTSIEISNVITNQYGNYWGEVSSIDGKSPAVKPTYAYMGHLLPHKHAYSDTYRTVNNIKHDVISCCDGCNSSTKTRENHSFDENGVCRQCGAWEANTANGDYITVKDDGVPVYSMDITSPDNSRILDSLPNGTFVRVTDVHLNDADNYWGRVVRIGNRTVAQEMYVYMGRGSLIPHGHTMAVEYSSKSDLQHNRNNTCSVCGYTETQPVVEEHRFENGICRDCGKQDVPQTAGIYVTTRGTETLRAERAADSQSAGGYPKGTCIEVTEVQSNTYGNYWGRVQKIDGKDPGSVCYVYMGYLVPHTHDFKTSHEGINNVKHKTTVACSGCNIVSETAAEHSFQNGKCTVCGAWQAYSASGGYMIINEEGVSLYSERLSTGKSKVLKTLHAGTYIEVSDVKLNSANYYWGQVTKIGNYTEKQKMYIYMGSGQVKQHGKTDHCLGYTYESINNIYHKQTWICSECDCSDTKEDKHTYQNGVCIYCNAWEPYVSGGIYITVKDNVILYSKRISNEKSKELKVLDKGTCLEITDVKKNDAGYYWGKVTKIDNTAAKTAMFVYMGRGSLAAHSHTFEKSVISTSDTRHTIGDVCSECGYRNNAGVAEDHVFQNGVCTKCGIQEIAHGCGGYITVRQSESLKTDMYSDASEAKNVPAGTYIEVSSVSVNKYGNYWGKVSTVSGSPVKTAMYTYLGNLQPHDSHDMKPYYVSKNDLKHSIGEKCSACDYTVITGTEEHSFAQGVCSKCGKAAVGIVAGNYVTFRDSEPLRAKPSKDAKSLKNVPAGTLLTVSSVSLNASENNWGIVSQIDGAAVSKTMYVYMGNVLRHESHDMQPYCIKKSDTTHETGLKCSGCSLTQEAETKAHHFSEGICTECGAADVAHATGGYLVVAAGNLKKDRAQDADNVQYAAEGIYLEVADVKLNKYGNYWGKVTSIGGAKPKQANAFVYMGNLAPHQHNLVQEYEFVDQDQHSLTVTCTNCQYQVKTKAAHVPVGGVCEKCNAQVPTAKAKGNYATVHSVPLYLNKNLTKLAGIVVEEGYLVKISSVAKNKENGLYYGEVSQYGLTKAGKDKLYIQMSEIIPHTTHADTYESISRCDLYHYNTDNCSLIGCTWSNRRNETKHSFSDGICTVCGKTSVPQNDGVYRVHGSGDVTLYSGRSSGSSTAGTAAKGSIIIVKEVRVTPETGNFWGEVTWVNGKKAARTAYVYMGSLDEYVRSSSATVAGADKTGHLVNDNGEQFFEGHIWVNGYCTVCGVPQSAPAVGRYLVNEDTYGLDYKLKATLSCYQKGSVLEIESFKISTSGKYYGKLAACNGEKVKKTRYVPLSALTFHGKHLNGSEHYQQLNDKQHIYDVNCPICGANEKTKANHVFGDEGKCILCGAIEPITDPKGRYYVTLQAVKVFKTSQESSKVLETLPAGTVLSVDSSTLSNGLYMGTGLKVVEDGELKAHNGFIHMSSSALTVHEHSWGRQEIGGHNELTHTVNQTCTTCGIQESSDRIHVFTGGKCTVCGAADIIRVKGDYTVKDLEATAYQDLQQGKKYAVLKQGDYVKITAVKSGNGVYYGKVAQIGIKQMKSDVYIAMHSLEPHMHAMQRVLHSSEDCYHIYKSTCTVCGVVELEPETHIYRGGICTVCGETMPSTSVGFYVADEDITVYKNAHSNADKVKKNSKITKGTHLYIASVEADNPIVRTEEDGSYWGPVYWGQVKVAGDKSYSAKAWVRMGSLSPAYAGTLLKSYTPKNNDQHTVKYECKDHCGLNGSLLEDHILDETGTCIRCAYTPTENGDYYTRVPNCKVYSLPYSAATMDLMSSCGMIALAGTKVKVTDIKYRVSDGAAFCKIKSELYNDVWINRSDLIDHLHEPAGSYVMIDDLYHQYYSSSTTAVCTICGCEYSTEDFSSANLSSKSLHSYENGRCRLCGMQEIPDSPGVYYVPYDGFFAYQEQIIKTLPFDLLQQGAVYQRGDKLKISKTMHQNGVIWGQIKNTYEYVLMRELLREPVKKTEDGYVLTDQELIDWCVMFNGSNPLGTYNYYTEMLGTIDSLDVLLMATNNRAGGLLDQVYKWIKDSYGETLAEQYYEGQILAVISALDEQADYNVSVPYKKEIKNVIKTMKVTNGAVMQLGILDNNDKEALKALNANLGYIGKLLDMGDIGLDMLTYLTMDFSRMKGVLAAARAMQAQVTDDPDLTRALENVINQYERNYYVRADELILATDLLVGKQMDDAFKADVTDIIKQLTGFDVVKNWSDWSFVYSTVNFVVDMTMQVSDLSKLSKASMQFMSQIGVNLAALRAYDAAVTKVKEGDHSAQAVSAVRLQFEVYKASVIELYNTMLDMACHHAFGIGEDSTLISYLQYEIDKLDNVTLVNDRSKFINAISFEEYQRCH